jgi:alkylated DNA repair dioxygenase AlkB
MLTARAIPGLIYVPSLLDAGQQAFCVDAIFASPWRESTGIGRRTQHYGWVYDYRQKGVPASAYLGPLPTWLSRLSRLVSRETGIDATWEQAIINEYMPGVGIGENADSADFGPAIATISLLGSASMTFRPIYRSPETHSVPLTAGDLLVMTGKSRRPMTHEIDGATVTERRISITFRTLGAHTRG